MANRSPTFDVVRQGLRRIWNHRLVDILSELPDGRRAINYHQFHATAATNHRIERLGHSNAAR